MAKLVFLNETPKENPIHFHPLNAGEGETFGCFGELS